MTNNRMPSIRVAYLINQYPAASHTFIRREIRELERSGVEIARIALSNWKGVIFDEENWWESSKTSYIQRLGVVKLLKLFLMTLGASPIRTLRAVILAVYMARHSQRPLYVHLFYVIEACAVADILKKNRTQHLHAHFGTNSTEVAMLASCLTHITYSFTAHGPEEFDKAVSMGLMKKVERSAFVVAVSSFGRGQLYRWIHPRDWDKVKVVHCGLEPGFHAQASAVAPAEKRLVCVGRLCEQKGQLLLIKAVDILAQRGLRFKLILAGDGELRQQIEDQIAARNLADHVTLTGWLSSSQVREEILNATALVLPSLAEGLPVAIMEAMALRRPVLSTYIAGIPELVRPGVNGWLFPSGSPEDLAVAMESCLNASPAELEAMGQAARSAVLERHDIRYETKKLLGHFLHVLQDHKHLVRK